MLTIEWDIRCGLNPSILSQMRTAALEALRCEGVMLPCSVSVCLCDDDYIAQINSVYRGIASSTDVLSFPTVRYPAGMTAGLCENLLRMEFDDEDNTYSLGEIIISVPHIARQASAYGHSEIREACYLLVHGLCHLMGYDHIKPEEKEKMRNMEEKILNAVSVSRDADPTMDDQTLLAFARDAMKMSYSPYSRFPVGAALHCTDGRVFLGCNIENASFGLTNCAERTAVFKAVSEGAREFDVIAIAAMKKAWPCGACRQVLNEFAPGIRVLVTWENKTEEKNLRDLLPEGFGPGSME